MRFFEDSWDTQPQDTRVYSDTFNLQTTRFVYWELSLVFPPQPDKVDFEIVAVYSRADGTEFARQSKNAYVNEGWTSSWHSRGRGSREPGQWKPGKYTVDLFIEEQLVGSGDFRILDRNIPETATFAHLREALSWASGRLNQEEIATLLALAGLMELQPDLASDAAALPWVLATPSEESLRALQVLEVLGREDVELLQGLITLPWLADGVSGDEWQVLRTFTLLAGKDTAIVSNLSSREWFKDGLNEEEAGLLGNLGSIGHLSESAALAIGEMPFLDTFEPADGLAATALRKLANSSGNHFQRLMAHPGIADGINDQEAKIVATLHRVSQANPALMDTLLDPAKVNIEERTISLPLAGEVVLTIIRTRQGAEQTMVLLEESVRNVEDFMSIPFPMRQVILLFEEATLTSVRGMNDGFNSGTHITVLPKFDSIDYLLKGSPSIYAHEAAHYYWTGNQVWINEGAANLIQSVQEHLATGHPIAPRTRPCAYASSPKSLK